MISPLDGSSRGECIDLSSAPLRHLMHVPATPAQLRALLDNPLSKRLVLEIWTEQLGALLDVEQLNDVCSVLHPNPGAARHESELLELLSDESIPWDVLTQNELPSKLAAPEVLALV